MDLRAQCWTGWFPGPFNSILVVCTKCGPLAMVTDNDPAGRRAEATRLGKAHAAEARALAVAR